MANSEAETEPTRSPVEPADEQARRQQLYDEHRKQAWDDMQSSTDSFDQSLLTLSSGLLALSVSFVKDIVPLSEAAHIWLLFLSWIFFALCILLTVSSFQLGIAAQKHHLKFIRQYYIERNAKALNKPSVPSTLLAVFTWFALVSFFAGILCTVIFCIISIQGVRVDKTKNRSAAFDARSPVSITPVAMSARLQEGRPPVAMTPVSLTNAATDKLERGRQPVTVTPVQTPKPPANPPAKKD